MIDCLFCKIITGEIPSDKVYENDSVLAFRDIDPKAPTHILIIPKEHIESTTDLNYTNYHLLGKMAEIANIITKIEKINNSGYRWVINTGEDGGQTVFHIHLHLLGGRKLNWPPG